MALRTQVISEEVSTSMYREVRRVVKLVVFIVVKFPSQLDPIRFLVKLFKISEFPKRYPQIMADS
jgi:hypothetical protein